MTDKAYIYGLADPRDRKIHYVGHTVDLAQRLAQHVTDTKQTAKTAWIAELSALKLKPLMVELAIVPYDQRFDHEYKWIYMGRAMGWPLTNTSAMKTNKYTHLFDGLGQTLVVEVDKGLTWRKVKQVGKDTWQDDSKFTAINTPLALIAGLLLAASKVMMSVSIWYDWDVPTYMIWPVLIGGVLMMPTFIFLFSGRLHKMRNDVEKTYRQALYDAATKRMGK